jgi:hypothetical protein
MADRMLFMGWGAPVRGREERAMEVFNEALGMLGRMQQDGRIERFDVALMAPNTELGGFIAAHGSVEQIAALRQDEEFMRNTVEAQLNVEGIRHIEGFTNDAVASMMALYQDAITRAPQMR